MTVAILFWCFALYDFIVNLCIHCERSPGWRKMLCWSFLASNNKREKGWRALPIQVYCRLMTQCDCFRWKKRRYSVHPCGQLKPRNLWVWVAIEITYFWSVITVWIALLTSWYNLLKTQNWKSKLPSPSALPECSVMKQVFTSAFSMEIIIVFFFKEKDRRGLGHVPTTDYFGDKSGAFQTEGRPT